MPADPSKDTETTLTAFFVDVAKSFVDAQARLDDASRAYNKKIVDELRDAGLLDQRLPELVSYRIPSVTAKISFGVQSTSETEWGIVFYGKSDTQETQTLQELSFTIEAAPMPPEQRARQLLLDAGGPRGGPPPPRTRGGPPRSRGLSASGFEAGAEEAPAGNEPLPSDEPTLEERGYVPASRQDVQELQRRLAKTAEVMGTDSGWGGHAQRIQDLGSGVFHRESKDRYLTVVLHPDGSAQVYRLTHTTSQRDDQTHRVLRIQPDPKLKDPVG